VFYIFAYRKLPVKFQLPNKMLDKKITIEEDIMRLRDKYFLDDNDSHNALVHGWFWGMEPKFSVDGLKLLVAEDGAPIRRYPKNDPLPASGDCLVAWCWAYVVSESRDRITLKKVADHFISHCFSIRYSTRSACGGVNYSNDGWKNLTQPCFGPQFYTASAVLSLAAKELGGKYKFIYKAYYVLFGGWLWWLAPVLHFKHDSLYYVHDITMRALWVVCKTQGTSPRLAFAMKRIISLTHQMNPFFYAHAANVGAVSGREKECEDRLLAIGPCFGFMPQKNPDDAGYFENPRSPKHYSIVAFALKLLWRVK
jgi:hypothetical protein